MLFAVTPANAYTIDHVALLGFVAQPAGLVRTRGTRSTVNDVELAVLPAAVYTGYLAVSFAGRDTHRTRRRKRRTSVCFFLYNSPMYLYAPICAHKRCQRHPTTPVPIHRIHFVFLVSDGRWAFVRLPRAYSTIQ